jgi:ATP-binding cassette subfamily F protein 3
MRAKDVLLESLRGYTGTVVFVSHDRYFIDNLATRVFEIEDGHVHVYPGNYEDYLWRKSGGASPIVSGVERASAPAAHGTRAEPQEAKKRVNPMKLEKLKTRLKEVEQRVARLESEIQKHEASLADFKSVEETMLVSAALEGRRKELAQSEAEWEELSSQMEAIA